MKTDLSIPTLEGKFFDLRDTLPGDAYKWSWERPLSEVKYLVIHHSAADSDQTPKDIAEHHINDNGWGGIGYHFLIDKDGKVFYVGDISTARANVANMNEQVIGIGLIGNFTQGRIPTTKQLDSARLLCEFFINDFPNFSVKGHEDLPNQKTICPGDNWQDWKKKLLLTPGVKYVRTPGSEDSDYILKSQIENLQTDIGYLQQQRISLQEALLEREKELARVNSTKDNTLTIVQGLINLYKFILPRRVETFG